MKHFVRSVSRASLLIGALSANVACTTTRARAPRTELPDSAHGQESAQRLKQARQLARVGDYVRAEQYAESALDGGANPAEVEPLLLEVCIKDRRYRAAIDHGEGYLKRNPHDDAVRQLLATIYAVLGHADNARRELEIVLQHRPDSPSAHYELGVLLRDVLSDFADADRHFREYLRLDPNGPHAAEVKSSLLMRLQ
jgi:tetratricopeptide (TPR) repeat protein